MLILGPEDRGPTTPLRGAPRRLPGSVRRTSTIDTTWPEGFAGPMAVRGGARDLRTTRDGAEVIATAELSASVGPDRSLTSVSGSDLDLANLVGRSTMRGFRSAVTAALPDLEGSGSPLRLLLDDLPVALMVSGFALLLADALDAPADPRMLEARIDICAGWADSGAMVAAARAHGRAPTPVPIESPSLEDPDDPLGWHEAPSPEPIATRRRRLLDVAVDPDEPDRLRIEALFRDSHFGADGVERSFHEYAVRAAADHATGALCSVEARPGVLPWKECPGALASAGRLVGTSLAEIRPRVRASFRGTPTCTHLNDVLAAIGDADVLAPRSG